MRHILLLAAASLLPARAADAPVDLRVGEGFVNPIGFHDPTPTLSWKLPPATAATAQSAYRIVAATTPDRLPDNPDLWDSTKVSSAQSAWIAYAGKPLHSRHAVHWMVKFWDQDGTESPWSTPANFELGLLEPSDWQARWIHMAPADGPAAAAEVTIEKALYGAQDKPDQLIDLTETLRRRLADGQPVITADNQLAGRDPAFNVVKTLHLEIVRDGRREVLEIPENQAFDLATGKTPAASSPFVPQHLRCEFALDRPVRSARLHVTAAGLYQVHLNGRKVGADFMTPGWTPYARKIETLTYDVTGQLAEGPNTLGAILGEGWFAGRLGWGNKGGSRPQPRLLAQLEVTHADGTTTTVASDSSWRATDEGPIRFSGIYDGETYDARRELPGWDRPGFDAAGWRPVVASQPVTGSTLAPKRQLPVRVQQQLPTVKVTEPAPGRFVFDLGQNIVGWPVLHIPVRKDQTVTVRFAEMLEKDGTLYTANYRSAKSTDTYTAAADANVTWHPTFTFHGFRYVELSGLPEGAKPNPGWVTGAVLHSTFDWPGRFTSSHELLNQLQSNIAWGLRGNFLEVPTDCPQRDERLGWTGDAQVFTPAAIFNAGVHAFLASWLESMRLDQHPDGAIPNVIPNILDDHCGGPGWSDAATVVPWEVYQRTGDLNVLADNFDMMNRWVGWYHGQAKDHIIDVQAYGDWLQPYPQNNDNRSDTPRSLIGTAYFARSADLTARAARQLGKTADADRLEALAADVKAAFTNRFFDAQGKLTTPIETQTGYLMALGFDLLPEPLRPQALANLVRLLDEADGHLRTGFLGTPLLAPVLDRFGRTDLAYGALFKETYPSWFFSIHQGATTMWERWNSYSHADGFGDAGMNSFNHYAYGAIGQWIYERIAGLAPDPAHPGYRHFFIQPLPGAPLTAAAAELNTPYGIARSAWKLSGRTLHLKAVVPPNTTATLRLPAPAGRAPAIAGPAGTLTPRVENGLALLDLTPGTHEFTITSP